MRVIKRYPNRKLYDTESKSYITLEGISARIQNGEEIQVLDSKTREDLTALTLTQIIFEQEKKRHGLLPHSVLAGLIRTGGDRLTALQRALLAPMNFWHQVDEEIRRRVYMLVQAGILKEEEGFSLADALVQTGIQNREEQQLEDLQWQESQDRIEMYLVRKHIPTQDDYRKLYQQVEELSAKIDQLLETR